MYEYTRSAVPLQTKKQFDLMAGAQGEGSWVIGSLVGSLVRWTDPCKHAHTAAFT